MNPGTEIHDGRKLVGVRFLPRRQYRVQFLDERMELSLEMFQRAGHLRRLHSILGADPNLDFFETRFTAKRAYETRIRYRQVFHGE